MKLRGNALVGQSGGPTSVINSSLAGVVETALRSSTISRVLGMRFGIEGVLGDHLVDLGAEDPLVRKSLLRTPGSALGSSRLKLKDEHLPVVLKQLQKYDIRYLFLIGGNDTMDTIHRVTSYAHSQGYELRGVGVPKTVDNDLFGTDHTPGYASAARYMALSVMQSGILARDMQRVDQFVIFQSIGRSAGWLPAATAAGRSANGDAPHILLLPERAFERDKFLTTAAALQKKFGFVSIVCGEGITYADGTPVSASETRDKFGNVEFGAMGGTSVAIRLHQMLSQEFGWRGEFQVPESLPMCGADRATRLDFAEAFACGKQAVKLALAGQTGVMVTMQRANGPREPYAMEFGTASLADVANHERPLPDKFIAASGLDVTPAFLQWVRPLIGELPEYGRLANKRTRPA